MNKNNKEYTEMPAMKASEDALLNEAKASAVANDAIIPRRPHRGGQREMSVGCDDGRFISPKESSLRVSGEGVSLIKNRSAFFGHLQRGLQGYFDNHDRRFKGIIHFAVGIKDGRVVGIIRRDNPQPFAPKEYLGEGLYYQKRRTLPNPSLYGGACREDKERNTNKKK